MSEKKSQNIFTTINQKYTQNSICLEIIWIPHSRNRLERQGPDARRPSAHQSRSVPQLGGEASKFAWRLYGA